MSHRHNRRDKRNRKRKYSIIYGSDLGGAGEGETTRVVRVRIRIKGKNKLFVLGEVTSHWASTFYSFKPRKVKAPKGHKHEYEHIHTFRDQGTRCKVYLCTGCGNVNAQYA